MRIVYAVASGPVILADGQRGMVQKGTHWPDTDPVVLAHPELFSPDARYGMNYTVEPDGYDAPIETATAAPGEKRSVRRAG